MHHTWCTLLVFSWVHALPCTCVFGGLACGQSPATREGTALKGPNIVWQINLFRGQAQADLTQFFSLHLSSTALL